LKERLWRTLTLKYSKMETTTAKGNEKHVKKRLLFFLKGMTPRPHQSESANVILLSCFSIIDIPL